MKNLFLISTILSLVLVGLIGCKTTTQQTLGSSTSSVNYIENYGAVGDGKTDDTEAFKKAVAAAHNRQIGNKDRKGWGTYIATEIVLKSNKKYKISRPIIIPKNKNITFRGEALGGAAIEFKGNFDFGFIVQPKSVNAAMQFSNITFIGAGVQILGSNRGKIILENNVFIETSGPGISIADARDVNPKSRSFGVVHWKIEYNEFIYCRQGISVVSKSMLLGTITKNRFNMTREIPLYIDAQGIIIEQNEFMGVGDYKYPYISLDPQKNPISNIILDMNRFGSEIFEQGGNSYVPPAHYIRVEEGQYVSNVQIERNWFFTLSNREDAKTGLAAVKILNKNVTNLNVVNGNTFRGFSDYILDNVGKEKSSSYEGNFEYGKKKVKSKTRKSLQSKGQ